jgi:serine/threonine protein kinase
MIHNDLKPGNILISSLGYMKLCDFGLVQTITSSTAIHSMDDTDGSSTSNNNNTGRGRRQTPQRHRITGMTTLNYRSPEVLLGDMSYQPSMDMYAMGVIFAELLQLPSSSTTLFHGSTEMEQIQQICSLLGTPNTDHWPEYVSLPYGQHFTFQHIHRSCDVTEFIPRCWEDDMATDLLRRILVLDPKLRCTSWEALQHEWFHNFHNTGMQQQRQCRLLVQEELIPPELVEPMILCHNRHHIHTENRSSPPSMDSCHNPNKSERDDIAITTIQALELAAKRRSFLDNLDQWR